MKDGYHHHYQHSPGSEQWLRLWQGTETEDCTSERPVKDSWEGRAGKIEEIFSYPTVRDIEILDSATVLPLATQLPIQNLASLWQWDFNHF